VFGDGFAEARGYDVIQALVAGGQNDQLGAQRRTVPELQSIGRKTLDVTRLDQTDLSIRDQFGTSDVEIIAAAASGSRPSKAISACRSSNQSRPAKSRACDSGAWRLDRASPILLKSSVVEIVQATENQARRPAVFSSAGRG
jgi:hypothetical protein